MLRARAILALLIAISLVLLPLAGGGAVAAQSTEISVSDVQSDCCEQHGMCDTRTAKNDCASMTMCAYKCCSFAPALVSLEHPLLLETSVALQASNGVRSRTGSPPFRPPRV
jgi:hypothetical protein